MILRLFLLLLAGSALFAQCSEEIFSGDGTYYEYSGGGNCSFPDPYKNIHSAAVNASQYKGAVLCGACAEITGRRGTIVVSLEDQCPECKPGDLDLEEAAFPLIDDPINGRVPIQWKIVPCQYQGPVSFYFKEGSSQYWTAVQLRNHINPIKKFEALLNGKYITLDRAEYNYFEYSAGLGTGPYSFRITDIYGNQLTETNITFREAAVVVGKGQFQACGTILGSYFAVRNNPSLKAYAENGLIIIENFLEEEVKYQIIDLTGSIAIENTVSGNKSVQLKMEQGIYLLKYQGKTGLVSQKMCTF